MAVKRLKYTILFSLSVFFAAVPAIAQINGSRGLMNVRSAWNLEPGYLLMYTQARFFGQVAEQIKANGDKSNYTLFNSQSTLILNYGISEHLELALSPILYQDTNRGMSQYNFIDDIYLFVKFGSLGGHGSHVKSGIDLGVRFPTGETHNILFEPYSTGRIGFGISTRFSWAARPFYPDDGLTLHFNAGYWNYNDVGEKLTDIPGNVDLVRATKPTTDFLYGVGLNYPTLKFDFSLEFYGNIFIRQPPVTAYSRENSAFISPRIRYKPYHWLNFDLAGDIRVMSVDDETDFTSPGVEVYPGMPNYPPWRFNIGAQFTLLPRTTYTVSERDILIRKAGARKNLFEQIIRDRDETDVAQKEVERIKLERRKAERELQRLQQMILEKYKRQQKKKEDNKESDNEG